MDEQKQLEPYSDRDFDVARLTLFNAYLCADHHSEVRSLLDAAQKRCTDAQWADLTLQLENCAGLMAQAGGRPVMRSEA